MKTIGVLGGTGWSSTIGYYTLLNKLVGERLGGFHSAKILLKSIDYHDINLSIPASTYASNYYYYPTGTALIATDGATTVYPDYAYYFCLGNQVGNFPAGLRTLTPTGVK